MTASIITIGDEILIGQIVDTNSAWLGQQLTLKGFKVSKIYSIADTLKSIESTLHIAEQESDLVVITGGLGPTKDDVTKVAICNYFNVGRYFAEELFIKISKYFNARGYPLNDAHREQCYMPESVELLDNNVGTAPGMLMIKDNKVFIFTPGVPHEMKWIFQNSVWPALNTILSSKEIIYHKTVKTVGIGETRIADMIEPIANILSPEISVAYLPGTGHVRIRLMSNSKKDFSQEINNAIEKITTVLQKYVYGYDTDTLEKVVLDLFYEKQLTVSTAESCTGGFLAHKLVSVPGSSSFYNGSYITYQNELKIKLLGVSEKTLQKHGAVSEQCVSEMLKGLLERTQTDVGVAISGIAGPGGGTKEKPVGTIWLAYGSKNNPITKKLQLGKDRLKNIEYTAISALNCLRMFAMRL